MFLTAVAYYRTSSLSPRDHDSDSRPRQADACHAYARLFDLEIVREFYDAGVSGADPIHERRGFAEMVSYMLGNGARTILVENASRFARDLVVQLTGHDWLKSNGIAIIPVDAPDYFTNETPTAVLVRQVLGAVNQFAKTEAVARMQRGRRKRLEETGWCGGGFKKTIPEDHRVYALTFKGAGFSLRQISLELAQKGYYSSSGQPYGPQSIARMIGDVPVTAC